MARDLTVTPEHRAFLASIIAAPDDDAPRLACADWMEENGDVARAELIRVQVEQSKYVSTKCTHGGGTKWSPCCWIEKLRRRERELLKKNCKRWVLNWYCLNIFGDKEWYAWNDEAKVTTASTYADINCTVWTFRRGFIESVRCDWPTWRDHGDAILAAQPVTEVTLTNMPPINGIGGLAEQYLKADNFEGADRARRHPVETALCDLWPRVATWRLPG